METTKTTDQVTSLEPSNFICFLRWLKTGIEDNNGKISIKRVIALFLTKTVCLLLLQITFKEDLSKFDWTSTSLILGVIFTQISALVTASIIEKKHILNSSPKPTDVA